LAVLVPALVQVLILVLVLAVVLVPLVLVLVLPVLQQGQIESASLWIGMSCQHTWVLLEAVRRRCSSNLSNFQ
jgi:hypothetical protein